MQRSRPIMDCLWKRPLLQSLFGKAIRNVAYVRSLARYSNDRSSKRSLTNMPSKTGSVKKPKKSKSKLTEKNQHFGSGQDVRQKSMLGARNSRPQSSKIQQSAVTKNTKQQQQDQPALPKMPSITYVSNKIYKSPRIRSADIEIKVPRPHTREENMWRDPKRLNTKWLHPRDPTRYKPNFSQVEPDQLRTQFMRSLDERTRDRMGREFQAAVNAAISAATQSHYNNQPPRRADSVESPVTRRTESATSKARLMRKLHESSSKSRVK